jgi:hypothetical protein
MSLIYGDTGYTDADLNRIAPYRDNTKMVNCCANHGRKYLRYGGVRRSHAMLTLHWFPDRYRLWWLRSC